MHTTHFIGNGPLQTAYQEVGEGDPFVLVHGFTGSKLDFHDQLGWFADLRRVIAYDQRGHGETSNQQPYTFEAMVDDLIGLLDALDIERCDLLGHSMGGMVAMRVALAHPERVRSLILMDTAAEPLSAMSPDVRQRFNKVATEQGCDALLPQLRGMSLTPSQQRGIDYLGEHEHWRRLQVKLAQMDPTAFAEVGALLGRYPSLLADLARISCPTTILAGGDDEPFIAPSKRMAERIPDARLILIERAAHCPQYEHANAWRAAVREHLLAAIKSPDSCKRPGSG